MRGRKIKWGIIGIVILIVGFKIAFRIWEESKGSEVIETSFQACRQATDEITADKVAKDLRYLKKTLEEVHPSTKDGLTPETRECFAKYEDVGDLTIGEFTNIVNEILTTLQDSHTSVVAVKGTEGLPIEAVIVDGKLYVMRSRDLCKGDQIIKVGGITVEKLWEKMKNYRAAENPYWLQVQFEDNWVEKHFLDYSGVSTSGGEVKLEIVRDGIIIERSVHFTNYAYKYKPYRMNEGKGIVSYEIDEEKKLCTLILTECEYSSDYIQVIGEMFEAIEEKKIKHLAIDIRGNSGGNSLVMNELVRYLPIKRYKQGGGVRRLSEVAKEQRGYTSSSGELGTKRTNLVKNNQYSHRQYSGEIYVLVDRHTYSSALMLATTLKDNNLAQVIGSPTGGKPHSYGDILQFQLPNACIRYSISYTEWYRADEKRNEDEWLVPDYEVEYSIEDIMKNRDKVKEELYEIIK